MSEKLKPCPFCGSSATISHEPCLDGGGKYLFVTCTKCRAKSTEHYVSYGNECPQLYVEVRANWNKRTQSTITVGDIAEIIRAPIFYRYGNVETAEYVVDRVAQEILNLIERKGDDR